MDGLATSLGSYDRIYSRALAQGYQLNQMLDMLDVPWRQFDKGKL